MENAKPWYLSRTIWASAVAVATSTAGLLGVPLAGIDDAALTDTILQTVAAISGIAAMLGRLSASTRIG